jgi:2-aminoethylphosphonate-pyruvate transaminase
MIGTHRMRTLLLTPGPLTTTDRTRAALGRDWGSRDAEFLAVSTSIRTRLAALAGVAATHAAIPIQGSGTFAVEAALHTLVPREGRLLVLVNGAYGRRIAAMAGRIGLPVTLLETAEDQPIQADAVRRALAADAGITDIALVHCETTSGLVNPLGAIADAVQVAGRRLLVDAMSSFGAIPIDGAATPFTALMGSANKGLEGVPGLSFVIAETQHLHSCGGRSRSLSLDLHDQWRGFEATGEWRFTPPVQVVAALAQALDQLEEEGGVAARHARYRENAERLIAGMARLGFVPFLDAGVQGPVIATFRLPPGAWFEFPPFYDFLHAQGIVIYPGKLTGAPSFRIGCIGDIRAADIDRTLNAAAEYVRAHRPDQAA